MSTETVTEPRLTKAPSAPVSMNGIAGTQKSPAEKIFIDMRKQIAEVFPNDDHDAWSWNSENYDHNEIDRPEQEYGQWHEKKFVESDEFSQLFTKRMFMVWDELKKEGFEANDKKLWEHQKALFAWTALNICTGNREEMAKLLVRSPYGSGKSLVTGLITRAFHDAQLELLHLNNVDPKNLPAAAQIYAKKEHIEQNASGEQYSVLQPPFNVERTDINQYWRDMESRHGEVFTDIFKRPTKAGDLFYTIFRPSDEEEENNITVEDRIALYIQNIGVQITKNKEVDAMLVELRALAEGSIVFLPDIENNLQPRPAQKREAQASTGFKGDSAHALDHLDNYHIVTSHKSLALDPSQYSTVPDEDKPAQFALVHGAALTRPFERFRKDLKEFAKRCKVIFMDEAGRLSPYSVGDSVAQLSGEFPIEIGVTGYDKGVEGWTRSPEISEEQMIAMGLMKPVSYIGIGDAENPPSPGTEEAWKSYEEAHFEDYGAAKELGIPQPHEMDTVICAKADNVHEYAKRIEIAHAKKKIGVEVFVYHADAKNRKSSVLNAFKSPKKKGDPKRILVATNTLIAEAHTIPNAEVYDVVDPMTPYMMDQLRGRLGHVRNLSGTDDEKENARTIIRELFLYKGKDPFVRAMAKKFGFEASVPDDNATWPPMKNMIGYAKYVADGAKSVFKKGQAILDAPKVWRRKRKAQGGVVEKVGTPLEHTNPHAEAIAQKRADQQRRRLEKRRQKELEETQRVTDMMRKLEQEHMAGQLKTKPLEAVEPEEELSDEELATAKGKVETINQEFLEKNGVSLTGIDIGPTMASPGSEEKLLILSARESSGMPLWNEDDRKDHGPLDIDTSTFVNDDVEKMDDEEPIEEEV
ncbi:hypothetical protein HOK40_02230 [Candidatus Peregrinibacteria bacterium]|nr:hypothetical protein [Candidatus Peregrinibacteria bacterium]